MDALERRLLDRDDVGVLGQIVRRRDHLRDAARLVLHQDVRQQQRERLVADELARAPHRMAEPERRLLAREARGAGDRRVARQRVEIGLPLALGERLLELELAVEMILDHALVAAGDEDEMLDAGLARLVDHVLHQRAVDHRQHLLRHGLGGRQEPGPQPGDGENGFADRFHDGDGMLAGALMAFMCLGIAEVRACHGMAGAGGKGGQWRGRARAERAFSPWAINQLGR